MLSKNSFFSAFVATALSGSLAARELLAGPPRPPAFHLRTRQRQDRIVALFTEHAVSRACDTGFMV